jgi:3',5'-cyclic AMP phosphodiesterase CpdA
MKHGFTLALPPARLFVGAVLGIFSCTVGSVLTAGPAGVPHEHGEEAQPRRHEAAVVHAPRPWPDRLVLTWAGDPSTTQAVSWRTDTTVAQGWLELSRATGHASELLPVRHPAQTRPFASDLSAAHYHTVLLSDLAPGTQYAYRVGDGMNWTGWNHFRTASAGPAPFSFIYFGDAQNDIRTHWTRVFCEAFRDAPRAAFTLHAGDLVSEHSRDAYWGEWFDAPGWVNAVVPVVATPGNHEYFRAAGPADQERLWQSAAGEPVPVTVVERTSGAAGTDVAEMWRVTFADGGTGSIALGADRRIQDVDAPVLAATGYTADALTGKRIDREPLKDRPRVWGPMQVSAHWRQQFAFPENAPLPELSETCYWFDYQGVRFISLDSNQRQAEQVPWLRAVLAGNRGQWTVVTFHHPIFSAGRGRDNPKLRELWKPVFDEFRVDLVLTGHDHTYARTGDVSDRVGTLNAPEGYAQAYDPAIGTVYVVSVSGPKSYELTAHFGGREGANTQLYQVVEVRENELHYLARTATGALFDAFVLQKRPGAPNRLVEVLPPVPPASPDRDALPSTAGEP